MLKKFEKTMISYFNKKNYIKKFLIFIFFLLFYYFGINSAIAANLSGTVFEDINYGGGAGRSLTTSSGVVRPNATVELYSVASGTATYVTSTPTNVSGVYTFSGLTSGNYLVRVVNQTVTSSRTGYVNTLRAVQTFRTNASSGIPIDVTDYVGGQDPTLVDPNTASSGATLNSTTGVFTAGLTGTAQSITNVTLGTSNITNINFGYNFDTIVNKNNNGQGSLEQFIINSNALSNTGLAQVGQTAGREVSIFMIPNGIANAGHNTSYTNQLTSYGAAQINIGNIALTSVTDVNTSIDGRTQTNNVKQSNGQETNSGQSGTGGFVGVSQTRLNRFDNPEIEILSNNIRGMVSSTTATGFELRSIAFRTTGVLIQGNNSLVQDNIIGMRADGSESGVTAYNPTYCLELGSGSSNMTARHNYVKCNNSGIRRDGSGSQMLVEYNEVDRPVAGQTNTFEAFLIIGAGNNDTAQYNLFKNQRGAGSELGYNANAQVFNLNIQENTYTGNGKNLDGTPSAEPLGIIVRTIGSNSVVNISKNIIGNNGATGILVQNTNRVHITQNSIFGNGPTGSLFGTTANLGIDLRTGDIDPNSMGTNIDGVTPNDGNIASTSANNGTDYPIITSSVINGTTVKIQGYVGIAPNDTDFANSILEFFIADDDGNNNGAIIAGDGQNVAHGEGKIYVDTCNTNLTDGNFNCTFYNVRNVTPGMLLTATATNQNNDTSEFSNLTIVQEEPFLFYPDNTRNAIPGETIVYPHELVSSESGNIVLNAVSNKGWTYTFFRDVNGNSILDSGDTAYSGGMSPSLGDVYNLYPSHSVKLLVKLFIPSNIAIGTVDSLVTTATLTPTAIGVAPKSLSVIDVTTVSNQNSGSLQLLKSVSPSGSQPPGANLTYTIAFTNTGAVALHDIVISDQVPANTKFVSAGFISGTSGTITAPAVNAVGRIDWTITGALAPGATGSVTFVVKIDN